MAFPHHRPSGSTGVSPSSELSLEIPIETHHRRHRTVSTSVLPTVQRRMSRLSVSSTSAPKISLDIPKAKPTPAVTSSAAEHRSLGAFSPTNSAEHHLRSITEGTHPDSAAVHYRRKARILPQTWAAPQVAHTMALWSRRRRQPIPSISRSPSPSLSSPTSSLLSSHLAPPPSPVFTRRSSGPGHPTHAQLARPVQIDPLLAALENASRLRARVVCFACGKFGSDFPRCPRCEAAWCSRPCRMVGNKGGKHVCRTRTA